MTEFVKFYNFNSATLSPVDMFISDIVLIQSEQGTVSYSEETLTENGFDEPLTNGTPRKKKKKRKKNAGDGEEVADEYLNTLLYDLGSIEEDVVTSPEPPADIPSSLVTPTIHSQPADILYIETNREFLYFSFCILFELDNNSCLF